VNGEEITQADRDDAQAGARAVKELEGVDIDAELQSLLGGER
jgi:hypothetical protein